MKYREIKDATTEASSNYMPCLFCREPTLRETLSLYGARCFKCYEAYCREPRVFHDVGKKSDDPRAWAYALQRRHEAGERLTPAQVNAYKAVIAP
jgi:hypothetical protein